MAVGDLTSIRPRRPSSRGVSIRILSRLERSPQLRRSKRPTKSRNSRSSQQTQSPLAAQSAPAQDQSFLGGKPAQAPAGLARHGSSYGDWMAPAAAGVAGAGAGAAGYAAYKHHQQDDAVPPEQEEASATRDAPSTYQPSGYATGPPAVPSASTGAYYVEDTPVAFSTSSTAAPGAPAFPASGGVDATPTAFSSSNTADPATTISMPPPSETALGGLESEGAHETGHIFPAIIRHDTDISVSRLHVPGEFPKVA